MEPNIFRIHLKPDNGGTHTAIDVLEFCKHENIIGVGWENITTKNPNEIY